MRFVDIVIDGVTYTECDDLVPGKKYLVQTEIFFIGTYNGNVFTNCQIYVQNLNEKFVSVPYVVPYIRTEHNLFIRQEKSVLQPIDE